MRKLPLVCAAAALMLVTLFSTTTLAQNDPVPHENPDTAEVSYDGIAILGYCSRLIDGVLARETALAESLGAKRPFANVPQGMEGPLEEFAEAGTSISLLIVQIEADLDVLDGLARQFRLEEMETQRRETRERLVLARQELRVIEESAAFSAKALNVPPLGSQSPLRMAYQDLMARITALHDLLALLEELLEALPAASLEELLGALPATSLEELLGALPQTSLEELLEALPQTSLEELLEALPQTSLEELLAMVLRTTSISLTVEPTEAFVGDQIEFRGRLSSEGAPLPNREVVLLLDGVPRLRTEAGPDGSYQGQLRVPYRYVPAFTLEALYYPQGADIGRFLASRSSPVEIKVLFYEATLELTAGGESYPGLDSRLHGRFDYGDQPVPAARDIQIYLDNTLVSQADVGREFEQNVPLGPDISVGRHRLLVVVPAQQRYAPVSSEISLSVLKAQPIIELGPPTATMMPFPMDLDGRVYSEIGPLQGALVEMSFASRKVTVETSDDGTFHARLGTGMNISLIGSRELDLTVSPTEPWNSPASGSWSLIVVNPILIAAVVLILAASAVPLARRISAVPLRPRREVAVLLARLLRARHTRLRREIAVLLARLLRARRALTVREIPAETPASPTIGPTAAEDSRVRLAGATPRKERDLSHLILDIYGRLLRLLQDFTGILLGPELTLREFAAQCAPMLGSGQKYLDSFTRLIERFLYSRHSPEPSDLEASRELSRQVEESARRDPA